jgi:hypothetical protein
MGISSSSQRGALPLTSERDSRTLCAMRRAIVMAGALVVVAALIGAGWWYAKDHKRIGRADLEHTVARKAGAERAVCVVRDANAADWLCAVIGLPTTRCLRAHVKPWGSVALHQAYLKCAENDALARYFTA